MLLSVLKLSLIYTTRLLRDAELFETKLNKIDGFGDTGTKIIDIVKERSVGVTDSTSSGQSVEEK